MTPIKATMPALAPTGVTCEDCDKRIPFGAKVLCTVCLSHAIETAEHDAFEKAKQENEAEADHIREWAKRRHLMGQISHVVYVELDLCADDIEYGHG